MKSNAATDRPAPLSDASVARAMDRVLESERAARTAVAECERACADRLERARQHSRAILERARNRIVALHASGAKRLESQMAEIAEQRGKSTAAVLGQLSDPGRRSTALERLAARLTTETVRPRDDD